MKKRISRKVNLIGIGVALTFLGLNVLGQVGNGSPTLETRETSNKADQNLKSISRINPSTLAMELDLPLTTYPGRNGNSLPIGFSYSSKIWRIDTGMQWWYMANTHTRYVTDVYARFAERSAGGWTSNLLSPRIEIDNQLYDELGRPWSPNMIDEAGLNSNWQNLMASFAANTMAVPCGTQCSSYRWDGTICGGGICWHYYSCASYEIVYCDNGGGGGPILPEPPPPMPLFYIKRLHVAMPDGSNHEFRASDTPVACGTNQNVCTPDLTGTYLSVDGTGMRLVRTASGSTLYLSDGSRYSFTNDALADSYSDTHGNKLSFSRTTNAETHVTTNKWTDSLGREIDDPMPHNWLAQTQVAEKKTVNLPGLNGQTQQYELTWANLKPRGCETDTSSSCVGANNVTGGALEDQTEKLYYETKYFCRGNISDNLVTQSNGEVLFPGPVPPESGIRLCNSFDLQRNANGEIILDANGNPIPFATRFNPVVLSEVKLPNGKKYVFKYNRFGEITKITYPTGSYETFAYGYIAPMNGAGSPSYDQTNRGVTEHRVYESNNNLQQMWSYSVNYVWASGGSSTYKITTRGPKANDPLANTILRERSLLSFYSGGDDFGYENVLAGMPSEERSYDENGLLRSRSISENIAKEIAVNSQIRKRDPRVKRSVTINFEPGSDDALATLTEISYDETGSTDPEYFSHLNSKQKKSYHYATMPKSSVDDEPLSWATIESWFPSSKLAAISETDYSYDSNYKARGIAGRPVETRVLNPANTSDVLAKSQVVYDETAYFDNGYTTTNWENPNSNLRGNATTTRTWVKETNTWLETHAMFDNFGNVRKVWDASGDPTRFVEVEYSPVYHYAYPTKTKAPAPDPSGVHGMTEGSEISRVYDFNTGLLTSVTDANGQTATTEYDALLRPIRINPPAGGSISETIYNDTPGNIWVKRRQQIDEYNWAESTTYFDNLGRAFKSRTKDLQGDVVAEIRYDNFGRLKATSNPYRVDANGNPTESIYWSKPRYDEINRVVETYAPALVDPNSSAHGPSMGTVQFGISTEPNLIGAYTVATDASGRKSRAVTGIYGLMRVDEATGIGGTVDQDLGTLANPNQPTSYSYNVKGELVKITQGKSGQPTQYRYFAYDSLGRLIRVRQPEQTPNSSLATTGNPDNNSWTAAFAYDVFGNVTSMTDAKNTTITNEYDKASRPVKRTYSDGTPQVEFFYDGKGLPAVPQFSRGALTKATSSVSEDRFTSFDNHGRLLASQQITDGQTYGFGYKYNLSGGLIEETYPSGRVVRNFLDSDGGLRSVSSKAGNGFVKQVASDFDYTSAGGVRKMKLGNGLWETTQSNERHQLTQVGLGTTQTNNNLFKIDYEYGELSVDGSTVDAAKNIGMIAKTTTTIPTTNFVQTFKYDAINRLTEAVEKNGVTQNWKQTFGYDRFGNRNSRYQIIGGGVLPINNITLPTINQTDNRFTTGQGYVYDFNGNLVQDAQGRTFTFDGNDKQIQVTDASQQVLGTYAYDGSGKRVKKQTNTETTIFVYDAGGTLVAEYSTQQNPEPTTSYLTTDHLGSPRVITDKTGNVIARRDHMPFGEEIGSGVGGRTESLKYSASGLDNIRKRFTGYEKDSETQLDFAEARMYQNQNGRFTSADPLMASANPVNPQTLNRYTYTGNNPVNLVDPSGLCGTTPTAPTPENPKPCVWLQNKDGSYFSVSKDEYDPSKFPETTVVDDPSAVTLVNPVFTGTYANVDKYNEIIARGMSAALGDDGMFYGFGSSEPEIIDDEPTDEISAASQRNWILFPDGFRGGIDPLSFGEGFEIHVYDRGGREAGIVSGRYGWIARHGHDGRTPPNIPRDVLNQINGANVDQLRRRELIPPRGQGNIRAGNYLFSGRSMFGAANILGLAHGLFLDYEVYLDGKNNGRSISGEYRERWKQNSDQKFINTVIGPLPNPCYRGACEEY